MRKKFALLALIAVLAIVNLSIFSKEKHLSEGAVVYLELAPVDPRSLMQGDYMALRFQLANDITTALPKFTDGYAVITLDEKGIATFKRIHDHQALQKNELRLQYRVRGGTVKLASNAFFFQEGHAKDYEDARFGRFRVNPDGELLLESMYDENLKKLGSAQK